MHESVKKAKSLRVEKILNIRLTNRNQILTGIASLYQPREYFYLWPFCLSHLMLWKQIQY